MQNGLIALGFLAVAIWQFYATYKAFRQLQTDGNSSTSAFAPLGFWFSLLFGFIMLGASIMIVTGQMGKF